MENIQIERENMLHELLKLLEKMLLCGAEVYRVEETATRMGTATGAIKVNAFVITSSIVMTMVYDDSTILTETRRINKTSSNDFTILEQYNEISRRFCQNPVDSRTLHSMVEDVRPIDHAEYRDIIGSMLASGSLSVFFGGTVIDGIVAALCGYGIYFFQKTIRKFCPNNVTFNLICSLLIGTIICVIANLFPMLHADKIMIGDIMLLVPGIAITLSVRDMIVGDTISGVLRVLESVLWAAGIAAGFFLAIRLTGGFLL